MAETTEPERRLGTKDKIILFSINTRFMLLLRRTSDRVAWHRSAAGRFRFARPMGVPDSTVDYATSSANQSRRGASVRSRRSNTRVADGAT